MTSHKGMSRKEARQAMLSGPNCFKQYFSDDTIQEGDYVKLSTPMKDMEGTWMVVGDTVVGEKSSRPQPEWLQVIRVTAPFTRKYVLREELELAPPRIRQGAN